ncbi:class I adenylate-forming enzyme family protein [Acuticoccus mangrovi]|uniref:AMP-binding protein n=1 Tax=Acuticoccus mangrovi TaxID=2796142 RepID=A0A934IHY7_9HYPH|nr:AMP-binding protein [Acuticoccus mangrovi]MBJ3777049.1 AMP-binding protein [Acuticoccus mangrovi]
MIRTQLIAPVAELLARQAAAWPDKIAYEDKTRALTYAGLAAEVEALSAHYVSLGLAPGGAVGIWLANSVDWVVATLAAIRAGAIAVPIAADATQSEAAYRVADAGVRLIVTTSDKAGAVAAMPAPRPQPILTDRVRFAELPASARLPVDDIDRTSMIVYTSGTTGHPKGVMLSTRSMLWVNAACWAPIFGLGPDDRVLSPLPLFHSYALNIAVLSLLANGASEFIMERFSVHEAMERLSSGGFTKLPGVPTMFHYLLLASKEAGINPLAGIDRCVSAGAILPATLNREFEDYFDVELLDGYGITETSTMVTLNWPGGARVAGSCGLPVPGLSVRLVDVEDCDVPPGMEGELIVRGPNVMQGYFGKKAETDAALRGGWYRTGDLARQDASGFLTITGRLKELIIRGGQNIAPAEVEETIGKMAGIRDCAVVGVPHETLGEVPVAFVICEGPPPSLDAIKAFCTETLSAYKLPHDVVVVDEIPRTGSGKTIRFRLRDAYTQRALA